MLGSVLGCGIGEGRCGERCGEVLGEVKGVVGRGVRKCVGVWGRCGKVCWGGKWRW